MSSNNRSAESSRDIERRRCAISESDARRPYSELNEVEQAIVEHALPRETINREKIVEQLTREFSESAAEEAFTKLKQENRLFRRGNKTIYVMIRRDLF